jgi:acetate kinase
MSGNGESILCLNSGSSSLKFAWYEVDAETERLAVRGEAERIGLDGGGLWVKDGGAKILSEADRDFADHRGALETVIGVLRQRGLDAPKAVGHRVVHGGADFTEPVLVTQDVVRRLRALIPFAPLHLPREIDVIESAGSHFEGIAQVACFDTAFHQTMPDKAKMLPIPASLFNEGVRRYGFHGLSCEYIVRALKAERSWRMVIAHLGNGCSLTAVKDGRSVDTTMSFTPAGGVMMGTRSGDIDPAVAVFLLREKGYDAARLDELVNDKSGLLGVSGISSDMRTLLELMQNSQDAAKAVELFCYLVVKQVAALAAVLGGIDVLVFTGGIGERAAPVRAKVCRGLEFLGARINEAKNQGHADIISTKESLFVVRVMETKEELMIARHSYALLHA